MERGRPRKVTLKSQAASAEILARTCVLKCVDEYRNVFIRNVLLGRF